MIFDKIGMFWVISIHLPSMINRIVPIQKLKKGKEIKKMNKHAKKWMNSTLAVGLISSGLLMGGGVTAEASSVSSVLPSYTSPYYSQEKQAYDAVIKAEQTRWLSDVKMAKLYVSALRPSTLKSTLESRLYSLDASIHRDIDQAFSMISKAEQTKLPQDIYGAKKYSSIVKDPGALSSIKYRLDALEQVLISQAHSFVAKAESTYLREDVVKARSVVGYMNDSSLKSSLMARLDVVEREIQDISRATYYVEQLELTYDQNLVATAKSYVVMVDKASIRDALMQRVVKVERDIYDINVATSYVQRLEVSYDPNLVAPAKKYVSLVDKASIRDSLNLRIAKVERQLGLQEYARSLVVRAESTKLRSDIDRAYSVVIQLENVKVKSELLARLKAITPVYTTPGFPSPYPTDPIIVKPVPTPIIPLTNL